MKERKYDATDIDNDLCFGRNSVHSVLESSPELCHRVLLSEAVSVRERTEIVSKCREVGVPWQSVSTSMLDNLCKDARHQGFAARMSPIALLSFEDLVLKISRNPDPRLLVLLDHVQDPQNLGAVSRSAEVFGATAILVPKRRAALPTSTVMRTSAGAISRIPVVGVVNVARTLKELKEMNYWIVGLHHEADETIGCRPMPEKTVLVTGSEDKGLSRLTVKSCDFLFRIPMQGLTGSLNSATAAAIGMYEWRKVIDNRVRHG